MNPSTLMALELPKSVDLKNPPGGEAEWTIADVALACAGLGKLEYSALRLREVADFSGAPRICAALRASGQGDKRWSDADEQRIYDLLIREASEFRAINEEIRAWWIGVPHAVWRGRYTRGYHGLYNVYLGWLTTAYEHVGRELRAAMQHETL